MRLTNYRDPKDKRNEEIVKLAQDSDLSYEEIGRKFCLTRSMVSHIAISHGVVRRPLDINPKKWGKA